MHSGIETFPELSVFPEKVVGHLGPDVNFGATGVILNAADARGLMAAETRNFEGATLCIFKEAAGLPWSSSGGAVTEISVRVTV